MRVRAHEQTPGLHPLAWRVAEVYLDGVYVERCLEADEEAGYVLVDRQVGDELQEVRLTGHVHILLPRWAREPAPPSSDGQRAA